MTNWCNRWLSRAGRLVLIKSILEAIPVYWLALAWIPESILNKTKRICTTFLWTGKKEQKVLPWVTWDQIARPKSLGGWGIKNIFFFAKALAAKAGWWLISTQSLWTEVIIPKYITPTPLLDWIRDMCNTSLPNGSIIWKDLGKAFPLVSEGLVWKIGDGTKARIGAYPWPGCSENHLLPFQLIQLIHLKGFFHQNQITDPNSTNIKDGRKVRI